MEKEVIPQSTQNQFELNSSESAQMTKLLTQEFESGYKSYLVKINPQFVQECYEYDKSWDEDFRE